MSYFSYQFNFRSLASDGCNGNGPLCGLHSLCKTAKLESVHIAFVRPSSLRCLLGVFLQVFIQCQCNGQSGDQARRQPHECHGQKAEFEPTSETFFARKVEPAHAKRIPCMADNLSAVDARRIGLITEVVDEVVDFPQYVKS